MKILKKIKNCFTHPRIPGYDHEEIFDTQTHSTPDLPRFRQVPSLLDIAVVKGCKIVGLDIRIVGMFQNVPYRFYNFDPSVTGVLSRSPEFQQWDAGHPLPKQVHRDRDGHFKTSPCFDCSQ